MSSSTDKESPLDWSGWHKTTTSEAERPTLQLDDPTIFPPIILPITSSNSSEEYVTFYAGDYELDMVNLHSDKPQYKRELEAGLLRVYFSSSCGSYVFGDDPVLNYFKFRDDCFQL